MRHSCLGLLPTYTQSHRTEKKKEIAIWKKQPCKYTAEQFFKNCSHWSMTCTIQKKRISKGMHYHCVSLMAYNSCIHNGYWKPVQTEQQTKALSFITSRTTGPWQLLWQKNVTVTGKKNILSSHQKLQYKVLSTLCNYLLTTVEQIWACTAKAACPCQQSLHPKKLQNHHSEKLRLKEPTKGLWKKQCNKGWRNTIQN